MEHRPKWIFVVLGMAIAFLFVGWLGRGDDFALSLFVGLGTTLALAWPLYLFEREFDKRLTEATVDLGDQIGAVDERVGEVESAVRRVDDELDRRIADAIESRRAADAETDFGPPRKFREDKSFDSLRDALTHSAEHKSIENSAIFVPVREHELVLRFSLGEHDGKTCIDVVGVGVGDRKRIPCVWSEDMSVEALLADLDSALRSNFDGDPPDDERWRVVLEDLAQTLEVAEQLRVKARGKPFEPLLARIDDNWLVTEFTLEYTGQPPRTFKHDLVFGGAMSGVVPDGVPDQQTAKDVFVLANQLFLDHDPYT